MHMVAGDIRWQEDFVLGHHLREGWAIAPGWVQRRLGVDARCHDHQVGFRLSPRQDDCRVKPRLDHPHALMVKRGAARLGLL